MKVPAPKWKILRAALWERSEGRCEVSGVPLDPDTFDAHHRRPKGMGGTSRADRDALSNLIAVDPGMHNGRPDSVHARRGWSEEHGYLLPQSTPWAIEWPLFLRGRTWVYLLNSGIYRPVP